MRTSNPALNAEVFQIENRASTVMTLSGTVVKSFVLLALCVGAAGVVWSQVFAGTLPVAPVWIGGLVVGLIAGLALSFKPTWAPLLAPVYALAEGAFLGAFSAQIETMYPGIPMQAVELTFTTFASLLVAYATGWIKPSENFKLGVAAATGAIALVYLVNFALSIFGWNIPFLHSSGWVGIGISVFIVIVAALNLVLDFDFIENGAQQGAPKYMEWYAAYGLLVTLVWLYIEFVRLLIKLQKRD